LFAADCIFSVNKDYQYTNSLIARGLIFFSAQAGSGAYLKGIKGFIPPILPKFELTTDTEYVSNFVNDDNLYFSHAR